MKVKKATIPADSLVRKYLPADYTDVYACEVETGGEINPDDIVIAFWTGAASSGWIGSLFRLRNFLVRFAGLKGSEGFDVQELTNAVRRGVGGSYGFMSIPAKNEHETVMLLTDRHLDARLSIHIDGGGTRKKVSVITVVCFKIALGRLYFFVIRPFHAAIVKSLLRKAVNKVIGKCEI